MPSPKLDYHNEQDVLGWCHHSHRFKQDVDYTGSAMPPPEAIAGTYKGPNGQPIKVPPLDDEEKLTIARWIDLGCPIDLDYNPQQPERRGTGWMLDEGRPTLTLTYPAAGENHQPLERILLGMHDYATGVDADTLEVIADFPLDGAKSGENLAGRFQPAGEGIWELKLKEPITELARGTLNVSVKDRQGNVSRIERTFSIEDSRQAQP